MKGELLQDVHMLGAAIGAVCPSRRNIDGRHKCTRRRRACDSRCTYIESYKKSLVSRSTLEIFGGGTYL